MMKQQFQTPLELQRQTYSDNQKDMTKLSKQFQKIKEVQLLMQKNNHKQMRRQFENMGITGRKVSNSKSQRRVPVTNSQGLSTEGSQRLQRMRESVNQVNQSVSPQPSRFQRGAYQGEADPAYATYGTNGGRFERSEGVPGQQESKRKRSTKKSSAAVSIENNTTNKRMTILKRKETSSLRMSHPSQDKNAGRVSFMTNENESMNFQQPAQDFRRVDFSNQKAASPIYKKQAANSAYRRAMFTPEAAERDVSPNSYHKLDQSPEVNIKGAVMDLEDQINTKIKDLEHKYNKQNVQFQENEMNILDQENQSEQSQNLSQPRSRRSGDTAKSSRKKKTPRQAGASLNSTPQGSHSTLNEVSQPSQQQALEPQVVKNVEQLGKMLNQLPPVKNTYMENHNDKVLSDITNLIENFEKVFVAYINENYRSFTERDLQRLIKEELKQNIQAKIKELHIAQAHQNCDPYKIEQVLVNAAQLKATNEEIRESIHKSGVTINQLAKSSYDLKNENYIDAKMDKQIRDIAVSIDTLNHLFNDVHLKVLENDSELTQIEIICGTTLSSHGHLQKFDKLEQQYKKLDGLHNQLKQQLFDQTIEYKQLQNDYDVLYKANQTNNNYSAKLANMEQMLEECRADNRSFIEKIESLQAEMFGKDRTIDKMRHQLKHGVAANAISPSFDHQYSGSGGTIASGTVQSKIEQASEQQRLLSQAHNNQLRWRNNSLVLIRLTQRLFDSMNQLQNADKATKNQMDMQKQNFETCKRDLEATIRNVKSEVEQSDLSVVKQGAQFMEPETKGESSTMDNIKTLKNMLNHQANSLKKETQREPKMKSHVPKSSKSSQTEFESNEFKPIAAPSISHYKPQELIRLEIENDQLKSELETLKGYQNEMEAEIGHLKECIKENKTKEFLREREQEREELRKAKMAEQEANAPPKVIETEESIVDGKKIKKPGAKLDELDKFEADMLNVKQSIKETDDLIEQSKKNNFTQEEMQARQPLKKKAGEQEELEDPKVVEERMVSRMNNLIIEKDQEILELTVQRQRQDELIQGLQGQVSGLEKLNEEKTRLIDERIQANLDEQELQRMRSECNYLKEKVESSQREINRLEEEKRNHADLVSADLSAQLASQIQSYNNLQNQLEEERLDSNSYKNQVADLNDALAQKGETHIRLQTEFNELCRIKQDLEAHVDELKTRLENQKVHDASVEDALREQLRIQDEQLAQRLECNGQLQRDLSSAQLQNRDLNDRYERQDKIFEREKLEIETRYQQEIMNMQNITEQLQNENQDLKEQMKIQVEQLSQNEQVFQQSALELDNISQKLSLKEQEIDILTQKNNEMRQVIEELRGKSSQTPKLDHEAVDMEELSSNIEELTPSQQEVETQKMAELQDQMQQLKVLHDQQLAEIKANHVQALEQLQNEHKDSMNELHDNHEDALNKKKDEIQRLKSMNDNQFGDNNKIRDMMKNKIEELNGQLMNEKTEKESLQVKVKQLDQLKEKLNQNEAKIMDQMQLHLKNEMMLKEKDQQLQEQSTAHKEKDQKMQELNEKVQSHEEHGLRLNETVEALKAQLKEQQNANNKVDDSKIQDLQDQVQTHEENHRAKDQQMEELKDKVQGHERTEQQLNDKIAQLKSKLAEQVAASGEHVNQNTILMEKLQLKASEQKKAQEELSTLNDTHQKLLETHQQLVDEHSQAQEKTKAFEDDHQSTQRENEEQIKAKDKQISDLHSKQETVQTQLKELQEKLETVNKDNDELREREYELEQEIDELKENQANAGGHQEELHRMKQQLQDKESQMKQLQKQHDKIKDDHSNLQVEHEKVKDDHERLKKEKEDDEALKEDDFWSRPSKMDDSIEENIPKGGLGTEDLNNLNEIQEHMDKLSEQIDTAKKEVIAQIEKQFQAQIDEINESKHKLINEQILAKTEPNESPVLQNDKIKAVSRIVSENQVYFIVHANVSLEDQIAKKQVPQVYMLQESQLEEVAKNFLMNFVPGDEKLQVQEQWLQQFENDVEQILVEQKELNAKFSALKAQILGKSDKGSDQEENEEIKELQQEYLRLSQQNVDLKTENNALIIKNMEERKRIQELNHILQQRMTSGQRYSESNENEKQISYGKNFNSFFGDTNDRIPIDSSMGNDADLSRAKSEGSSDGDKSQEVGKKEDKEEVKESESGPEVIEHVKSNLKIYLSKTPIIDTNNEIILQIVFSMLHMSKKEIADLKNVRLQLPIYKIDEKSTKKAQKSLASAERGDNVRGSDPYGDAQLTESGGNLRHSVESATKTKFLGLFKKSSNKELSEGSFGRKSDTHDLSSSSIGNESKTISPAPFAQRKQAKQEDSD